MVLHCFYTHTQRTGSLRCLHFMNDFTAFTPQSRDESTSDMAPKSQPATALHLTGQRTSLREIQSLENSSEARQRTQSTMLLKLAINSWALLAIIKMRKRLVKVSVKPSLHNEEAVKYSREALILCAILDKPSVA